MHLDNFEIVSRAENFRRLAREPEQRVDAGRKIRRPHHGNFGHRLGNVEPVGVGVAGSADDEGFAVAGAKRRDFRRDGVRAEINHHVAFVNDRAEVVVLVNLAGDFEFAKVFRARNQRLAHAAFRTSDDDFNHSSWEFALRRFSHLPSSIFAYKSPHAFIVARNFARFAALIGTSGKRYSSSITPIIASAALTGTGFVSRNKSLNSGVNFA